MFASIHDRCQTAYQFVCQHLALFEMFDSQKENEKLNEGKGFFFSQIV